jgi:hypothetical protein
MPLSRNQSRATKHSFDIRVAGDYIPLVSHTFKMN